VKQPAVDHRIEGATQLIKLQGVTDLKIDAQPPLLRLRLRFPDGDGDEVETPDLMPTGCQLEGVLSGAAPGVEHRSPDHSRSLQPHELRLGTRDVPGRLTLVCRLKTFSPH
jgi:hypothetical protein